MAHPWPGYGMQHVEDEVLCRCHCHPCTVMTRVLPPTHPPLAYISCPDTRLVAPPMPPSTSTKGILATAHFVCTRGRCSSYSSRFSLSVNFSSSHGVRHA